MTTGRSVYGSRARDRNGVYFGSWTEKTWTGGDRPVSARRVSLSGLTPEERRLVLFTQRRVNRAPFEPHNYQCTINSYSVPLVTYWNELGKWGSNDPQSLMGAFGGPQVPQDPWTDNHHLHLVAKLRDEIVGGGANLAITIAESAQTLRFIGDTAHRVAWLDKRFKSLLPRGRTAQAKLFNAMRRGVPTRVVKTLRDDWLAYQYAVKPLLGDIREACRTLANYNNRKRTTRFRVRDSANDSIPGYPSDAWGGGTTTVQSSEQIVAYISDGPSVMLDASGILDPASVLWEKTRLSFVADWFIPVGDFLKAVSFWRNYEGQFVTTRRVIYENSGYGSPGRVYTITGGPMTWKQVIVNRTVGSDVTIPYPKLHLFDKAESSLRHAISGVALLIPDKSLRR